MVRRHGLTLIFGLFLFTIARGITPAEAAAGVTFFVSPSGSDDWSGTKPQPGGSDGPFLTVGRAQRAIRDLAAAG
ncbi:MAG: hypothetical protein ACYC9O_14740, partial [Candidatus Latescibacterota bacterium]